MASPGMTRTRERSVSCWKCSRRGAQFLSDDTLVESAVPDGYQEVLRLDGEGACEVDGVCAAQGTALRQFTSMSFNFACELDGTRHSPELLPVSGRRRKAPVLEVVVAVGGRERSADLRVRDTTRERRVASVPQRRRYVAAFLVDDQLHQGAGVEVDEGHGLAS